MSFKEGDRGKDAPQKRIPGSFQHALIEGAGGHHEVTRTVTVFGKDHNLLPHEEAKQQAGRPRYDIIEIGPGHRPARNYPGTAFNAETTYLGIGPERPKEALFREHYQKKGTQFLDADFADLSALDDGSTDRVIMRSVFGEYTMDPEYTGSNLDNTRAGLFEAFRIIREGGKIVIAEENTPEGPAHPAATGSVLISAGFTNVTVMPSQDMQNPHWRDVRSTYWNLEKDPPTGSFNKEWGFIITADRPSVDPSEFTPIEKRISDKQIWQAVMAGELPDDTDWTRTKTYLERNPAARQNERITILTKDGSMDMDTYLRAEMERKTVSLFL